MGGGEGEACHCEKKEVYKTTQPKKITSRQLNELLILSPRFVKLYRCGEAAAASGSSVLGRLIDEYFPHVQSPLTSATSDMIKTQWYHG